MNSWHVICCNTTTNTKANYPLNEPIGSCINKLIMIRTHKMIDWNELIKSENTAPNPKNVDKCRNKMGFVGTDSTQCRNTESKDYSHSSEFVPTVPTVPTQKGQGRNKNEKHPPREGGTSDNFSAAKMHPINPIAVTLLLTCCNKATVSKEETLEAIWKLHDIPQSEQIKSWATLCHDHGIDPHRVIYPFTQSPSKGISCQGCKNIEMNLIPSESKRPAYRFVCSKNHQILEAFYIGERVLIAPESCTDYLPTA